MFFKSAAIAALATVAAAQNSSESICDKYTQATFKSNTLANQTTLLTLLVNTAVIGSYSSAANSSVKVDGILNPNGTYQGVPVNLVPYFSGALKSTNVNGQAANKNFLDGGGAAPLKENMPANDTSSNQYFLLTHLYQFFGTLLGCSQLNASTYQGDVSMYEVHKFMVLDQAEMGYFIEQVALSAQSFGVSASDIATVGSALNTNFNYRCEPAGLLNATQSICTDPTCPLAPNSNCTGQAAIAAPSGAASASSLPVASATGQSGSGSGAQPTGTPAGGDGSIVKVGSAVAALAGAVALVFV